ncbi:hypothetical protein [Methylotuvimicrobium sp.]|uniref:hypothetical protein n=1 Tax=Methylotuvimicrobium sp. TaxID=2822413 RepID=UPI003D647C41
MNKNNVLLNFVKVLLLMVAIMGSSSFASVVTYKVTGVLYEPATQPNNTNFVGSFDWDGSVVSNLQGAMNSSMYEVDDVNPDFKKSFPLLHLNYQLAQSTEGDIVTASVFLKNSTDVFYGGGYQSGDVFRYGTPFFESNTEVINSNAYFTFSFDKTTMAGIVQSMVYGDCTAGGMMGEFCMTGHSPATNSLGQNIPFGSMGAYPLSLEIAAVPLPSAVWLFGSAVMGLMRFNRKRELFAA